MTESRKQTTLRGRDARQGEIILRTPARRAVFVAGLVGIILLALMVSAIAYL